MKKFVITGIGRSGTNYSSKLFTAAGVETTWETAFKVNKRDLKAQGGDSSWLAAPFLSKLPEGTVILHQTRDPLKWLQSWLRSSSRWPLAHRQFVNEHSGLFRWDRGKHPQMDMRVFVRWNKMVEEQAAAGNYPYLRFKVEDLDLAKMQEIAVLIDAPLKVKKAEKALVDVSKKTNTSDPQHRRVRVPNQPKQVEVEATSLKWADLSLGPELDAFKALAVEYGYGVTDE